MINNETLTIKTLEKEILKDITNEVQNFIASSDIKTGQITLFVPHTTAAVTINENADLDVARDILYGLEDTFPNLDAFKHMEGNSDAHIKSSVIGNTQVLLIEDGRLKLGTWQGIYFCEFDGPRTRNLYMQIIGS